MRHLYVGPERENVFRGTEKQLRNKDETTPDLSSVILLCIFRYRIMTLYKDLFSLFFRCPGYFF